MRWAFLLHKGLSFSLLLRALRRVRPVTTLHYLLLKDSSLVLAEDKGPRSFLVLLYRTGISKCDSTIRCSSGSPIGSCKHILLCHYHVHVNGVKVQLLHLTYCRIYVYVLLLSVINDTIIVQVSCRYCLWSSSNVKTYVRTYSYWWIFFNSFINFQLTFLTLK